MTASNYPAGVYKRLAHFLARYSESNANLAQLLCDCHAPKAVAYTLIAQDLTSSDLTYGALRAESERLASSLSSFGLGVGDRIATLMGKSRAYLVSVLAIWRLGAVHVPLFTAFAPSAIALRLTSSGCKMVICDSAQRDKLSVGESISEGARWKIVTTGHPDDSADAYEDLLARGQPGFSAQSVGGDAPIIQIYTSGTTGKPKGVVVPLKALASFHTYVAYALDVRADDIFWNAADPGWAYGLYYGVVATFMSGARSILLEGGFSAERTFAVLARFGVTNLASSPTVYRSLRASGISPSQELKLRCASSAGEPLTAEVNDWAAGVLGVTVHDHYGQTETGMVINNHHHPAVRQPLKSGSIGHPMPGLTPVILRFDRDEPAPAGEFGRLAVDLHRSPLAWFQGYVDEPEKSAEKFSADGCWYVTGDVGRVDEDGCFYFSAREDDVIIMAGYRIGPFEVESVLGSHPAVNDCAVIAVPDEIRGEVLEAVVVVQAGYTGAAQLTIDLQRWVKDRYGAHAYPRRVHYTESLPRTSSGKLQRSILRQQFQKTKKNVSHSSR